MLNILKTEEDGVIYELEDWDSMVNDQNLGKPSQREMVQVTMVAMAKIYRRIQSQSDILGDKTAQWHLMRAWIDCSRKAGLQFTESTS